MEIKLIQTQFIPLSKLEVNKGQVEGIPSNPRRLDDDAFAKLKKSIEERPGMLALRELCVYPHGNKFVVLGGNMRLRAMRELKYKEAPCKVITEDTPLDELKAFVVVDNSSFGSWDYDALANEWDDLPLTDWGVPAWDTEKETPPATATEDDFNEDTDNVETRCKRGDVWVLGEHRLMCGDSTDADCLAKLMNGHKADMVFTDPPYGVEYQSNARKEKFDKIKNDDTMLDFLPVLKPYVRGFVFVCASWKNVDEWIVYFKAHYPFTNMVVWNKGGGGLGDLKHSFATDYELILVSNNGQELKGKRIGSVWNAGRDNGNDYLHPTQKPVTLSATAIENTTDAGGIVADVFGGSGSTLIACEQLGRKCFTMELDEHYCDVILARWEKLTGKTAERAEN